MMDEPESPHFEDTQCFEDTYPRYEFAPLVRCAVITAAWLKKRLARRAATPSPFGAPFTPQIPAARTPMGTASARTPPGGF